MIESFGFSWFRSFREPTEIGIAPITLVYGQNAAGKSSALKALLLLKMNLGDASDHGEMVYAAGSVDLGSAKAVAHQHLSYEPTCVSAVFDVKMSPPLCRDDGRGRVEIELRLPHDDIDSQVAMRFLDHPSRPTLGWDMTTATANAGRRVWILKHDSLEAYTSLFGGPRGLFDNDDMSGELDPAARPVMRCAGLLPAEQIGTFSGGYREFPKFRFVDRGSEYEGQVAPAGRWDNFSTTVMKHRVPESLRRIGHIGPARKLPNRIESTVGSGESGESSLLVAIRQDESLRNRLNNQLWSLGIEYEVISRRLEDAVLGELHSLELRNSRSGVVTALTDVGYGVSQILPVVLEAHRPGNELLLVEQPELHLHPALQARLADLFISTAMGGNRTRFLIETHSEALILRLLRRIREGVLPLDALKVLYVDQDEAGVSFVKEILIDQHGEFLTPWPHGFFDERLRELMDNFSGKSDAADGSSWSVWQGDS
jgi:predicted ATPase